MRTLIHILAVILAAHSAIAAGYPWWLVPPTSTGGTIRIESAYSTNTAASRLIFAGAGVSAMTTAGGTSTVTIAAGSSSIDAGTINNAAWASQQVAQVQAWTGTVNNATQALDTRVSSLETTGWQGGQVPNNITISNSAPELRLANGPSHFRIVETPTNVTMFRKNWQVWTNVTGFSAFPNSIVSYFFESTNTSEPVVVDRSASGAQNGWVNLGGVSQPTRISITNSPVQTYGYQFDGTNDFLYSTNASLTRFGTNQSFSVDFWINDNSGGGNSIMGQQDQGSSYAGWAVQNGNSGNAISFLLINDGIGAQYWFVTSPNIPAGSWVHVACVYQAGAGIGGMSIWTNGARCALTTNANTLAANITTTTAYFEMGGRGTPASSGNYWGGKLYLPTVYTNVLPAPTITNHWQNWNPQSSAFAMPPGATTNITTNATEDVFLTVETTNGLTGGNVNLGKSNHVLNLLGSQITANGNPVSTGWQGTATGPLIMGTNPITTIGLISGNGAGLTNGQSDIIAQDYLGGQAGALYVESHGPCLYAPASDTDANVDASFSVRKGGVFKLYMEFGTDAANAGKTMAGVLYVMHHNRNEISTWNDALGAVSSWAIPNTAYYSTNVVLATITVSDDNYVAVLYGKTDNCGGAAGNMRFHQFYLVRQ